jgi:hypothetical protein
MFYLLFNDSQRESHTVMPKTLKTKPDQKDEQITVKVENELKGELEAIARREDRTVAQVARIALKEFIQRRKAMVAA